MEEQSERGKFMAFDPKITLGNYITIGTMLVGMALAYSKLATRDELKSAMEDMRKDFVTREVNSLQIQLIGRDVTALTLKVDEMKVDVKEIKRFVR